MTLGFLKEIVEEHNDRPASLALMHAVSEGDVDKIVGFVRCLQLLTILLSKHYGPMSGISFDAVFVRLGPISRQNLGVEVSEKLIVWRRVGVSSGRSHISSISVLVHESRIMGVYAQSSASVTEAETALRPIFRRAERKSQPLRFGYLACSHSLLDVVQSCLGLL